VNTPKFSEVLRAYAKGYWAPYDPQRLYSQAAGQGMTGRFISPDQQEAEHIARSVSSAFNQLAALYEQYEKANDPLANARGAAAQAAQLAEAKR
jgi:hypothetical protein